MACLAVEIQKLWKMEVKSTTLNTAFEAVMKLPEFRTNPVRDFIKFAQWDGTPRVDLLFAHC